MTAVRLRAAVVGLMVLAAGCTVGTTPGPSATPSGTHAMSYATGPTDLVVRASAGGGLLPPSAGLVEMPNVSIYGDGRLVRLGAHGGGPRDPLLPELFEARITPDGMARILEAAAAAGVLGPDRHYELPGVYDLWTVRFTVTADGITHRVSAYALGFADEERLAPVGEMDARRRLDTFYGQLVDLRAWLPSEAIGPDAAHEPAETRVFVTRLVDWSTGVGSATPAPVSPRPDQEVRDWPLSAPPELFGDPVGRSAEGWNCSVVGPDGVGALGLETATWDTRWQADGHLYQVVARPLLPDEAGCPTSS